MRKTMLTILAVFGLLTFGIVPASAATDTPTQDVTDATFQAVTNTPSQCAVIVPDESYTIPVPASVAAEINAVGRYGFHRDGASYSLFNSGAYPGVMLIANRTVTQSLYIPYLNTTMQIQVLPHQYDVFIPGYQGRPCTQWVHLVAQG